MNHKKKARSHEDSRSVICILCFSKSLNGRKMSNNVINLIKKVYIDFDIYNPKYPMAICDGCRKKLVSNPENLSIVNYDHLNTEPTSDKNCDCVICQTARLNNKVPNRLSTKKVAVHKSKNADYLLVCGKCFNRIGKGVKHCCTKREKIFNIIEHAQSIESQVASRCIQKIRGDEASLQLKQCYGKPLKISLNPTPANSSLGKSLNDTHLQEIKLELGLSQNGVKRLITRLRQAAGRNIVQLGSLERLTSNSHAVDDFFVVESISGIALNKSCVGPTSFVYCHRLNEFLAYVLDKREFDYEKVMIKIGFDSGGNSLKISLQIQEEFPDTQHESQYKNSGVKKSFIIGLIENAAETYENFKIMFELLNLNNFIALLDQFYIVADLKAINMILGKLVR